MFCRFQHRGWHYLFLLTVGVGLFLVNLGMPSLWDKDEGRNATAALEMLKSGDYIVPCFNSDLRVDKPALLYWLQVTAYKLFGIHEFSARLPSALASLLTLLLGYELGRSLFGKTTGLLAAFIMSTTPLMYGSARFANPDALLHLFVVAIMFCCWQSQRGGVWWFVAMGIAAGLAVLAKGPVGVVLPGTAITIYSCWTGQMRAFFRPALVLAAAMLLLVALPWYVLVAVETKAKFLTGFFFYHNVSRFLSPLENHDGSFFYYPVAMFVGAAPWSVFWWLMCRPTYESIRGKAANQWPVTEESASAANATFADLPDTTSHQRQDAGRISAYRFLASWLAVVLAFFSLAATKLPNYILPAMLPCALLAAHQLIRWCRGEFQPAAWLMYCSFLSITLIGLVIVVGTLMAAGVLPGMHGRIYPGLERLAPVGFVPIAGGMASCWLLSRRWRTSLVCVLVFTGFAFTTPMALWASSYMDAFKAPRSLVQQAQIQQTDRPIDVYCWKVEHLPSLNFYARRDVTHCGCAEKLLAHLRNPTPAYIILPVQEWESLKPSVTGAFTELAHHHDMLCDEMLIVVSNR